MALVLDTDIDRLAHSLTPTLCRFRTRRCPTRTKSAHRWRGRTSRTFSSMRQFPLLPRALGEATVRHAGDASRHHRLLLDWLWGGSGSSFNRPRFPVLVYGIGFVGRSAAVQQQPSSLSFSSPSPSGSVVLRIAYLAYQHRRQLLLPAAHPYTLFDAFALLLIPRPVLALPFATLLPPLRHRLNYPALSKGG